METDITEEHIVYLNDGFSIGIQYEEGKEESAIVLYVAGSESEVIPVDSESFNVLARAFGRAYQYTQV